MNYSRLILIYMHIHFEFYARGLATSHLMQHYCIKNMQK